MSDDMDVRIGEVVTDISINEGAGGLSADAMKAIVAKVLEQVRMARERDEERNEDTSIHDRVFRPRVG